MIELLVNWVAAILQENGAPMSVGAIADHLNHESLKSQPRLDVLLSLDQRFQRVGQDSWSLNPDFSYHPIISRKLNDADLSKELVEKAILLRQQAIDSLLEQRASLQDQITGIETRLQEIQALLSGLDYGQVSKRSGQEMKAKDFRSIKAEINTDHWYRSAWPLPGQQSLLLNNLALILIEIQEHHPSFVALIQWFKEYFKVGNWAKHSILACVIYPGFASLTQDQVVLTELGKEYLTSRDTKLIVTAIRQSFWGVEEMLVWLDKEPLTMDQLYMQFNSLGAGWKKVDQVRYRLNWLIAAGQVVQEPGSWPTRYMLVRS